MGKARGSDLPGTEPTTVDSPVKASKAPLSTY